MKKSINKVYPELDKNVLKDIEFRTQMIVCSIICWVFVLLSYHIPFKEIEQKFIFYISLSFSLIFTINSLFTHQKIIFKIMIFSKLTKEKVIYAIKSQNSIAELGYEDGILSHLSCEVEIDGSEIIVEFAVPSNQLDISNTKLFDATKLTDYITEFS